MRSLNDLILDFISEKNGCSSGEINEVISIKYKNINRTTITRHLNALNQSGDIIFKGKGSGRKYFYNDIDSILSDNSRPSIPFSMGRLDYSPFFTKFELMIFEKERILTNSGDTYATSIFESMVIDLSFGSSQLEGNTYSLLDTQALINYGETSDTASRRDTIMILNHKDAVKYISKKDSIDMFAISHIQSILMADLIHPKDCGLIRSDPVNITSTKYKPPRSRTLIVEAMEKVIRVLNEIQHPIEKAMYLMVSIPYIQPYADGNKRTGRVSMNIPLIHSGFPPMSFKNMNKKSYIKGIIAFYELGYKDEIKKAFTGAYKDAGKDYVSRYEYHINPDAIAYRLDIRKSIHDAFIENISIHEAMEKCSIPERLLEYVENEYNEVHEENCSIYGLEEYFLNIRNSGLGIDI